MQIYKTEKQRNELFRQGTFDACTITTHYGQYLFRRDRTKGVEVAGIDAEIMRRANRLGDGYQSIVEEEEEEEPEEIREDGELEQETAETKEDSVIM